MPQQDLLSLVLSFDSEMNSRTLPQLLSQPAPSKGPQWLWILVWKNVNARLEKYLPLFRVISMNYACKKVEISTLPLKYLTMCKNPEYFNTAKEHWMILVGYSSSHFATLSLFVKLNFSINLQLLKIMLYKICLCCRLKNIQGYEWAVIIRDILD